MFRELRSGGQTGVDRALLDAALEANWPCGGWCPRGRLAEDGALPPRYPLRETPHADPAERTRWNVRDSDATLILMRGTPRGGTALTIATAKAEGKPWQAIDPGNASVAAIIAWAAAHQVTILNVAGPRESECPGIYGLALHFVRSLLHAAGEPNG